MNITILRGLVVFLLASFVTANPAFACISPGPDGFDSSAIWKNAPDELPKNAMVLKVDGIKPIPETWSEFVAKVPSGTRGMIGKTYRFRLEIENSCVTLGRRQGFIVVRRSPMSADPGAIGEPQPYLSAVSYNESWLNWIVRLFSDDAWQFRGKFAVQNGYAMGFKSERDTK